MGKNFLSFYCFLAFSLLQVSTAASEVLTNGNQEVLKLIDEGGVTVEDWKFSQDGKSLAVRTRSKLNIYKLDESAKLADIAECEAPFNCVNFSFLQGQNRLVARSAGWNSGAFRSSLYTYDLNTGKILATIDKVDDFAVSSNGDLLAVLIDKKNDGLFPPHLEKLEIYQADKKNVWNKVREQNLKGLLTDHHVTRMFFPANSSTVALQRRRNWAAEPVANLLLYNSEIGKLDYLFDSSGLGNPSPSGKYLIRTVCKSEEQKDCETQVSESLTGKVVLKTPTLNYWHYIFSPDDRYLVGERLSELGSYPYQSSLNVYDLSTGKSGPTIQSRVFDAEPRYRKFFYRFISSPRYLNVSPDFSFDRTSKIVDLVSGNSLKTWGAEVSHMIDASSFLSAYSLDLRSLVEKDNANVAAALYPLKCPTANNLPCPTTDYVFPELKESYYGMLVPVGISPDGKTILYLKQWIKPDYDLNAGELERWNNYGFALVKIQ